MVYTIQVIMSTKSITVRYEYGVQSTIEVEDNNLNDFECPISISTYCNVAKSHYSLCHVSWNAVN